MPTIQRNSTPHRGVHYLLLKGNRGAPPEKMFYIRYRKQGRLIEERVGGEIKDGMTDDLAASIRENRISRPENNCESLFDERDDSGNPCDHSAPNGSVMPELIDKIFQKMQTNNVYQILTSLFKSFSDGISVSDKGGRIVVCNEASARLCGVGLDELIGKNCLDLVREGVINRSITLDVLEKRRRSSLMMFITKTKKHLLVTGTPVFDDNGEIELVIVNERDITQLNKLRVALTESRLVAEKVRDKLAEISQRELQKNQIIAESDKMQNVLQTALKLGQVEASNILIQGESGTGKGLVARYIHNNSRRKKQPFVQVNCAALPEGLLEAELFGYEKGAFTGANQKGKAGLFELAHNGTLFLDEIGDLPQNVQAKLLKCLEEHEIMHVGGIHPIKINSMIIAATNQHLGALVRKGEFRNDLFFRLNEFNIIISPIRERKEDTLALAIHYLNKYNHKYKKHKRFDSDAIRYFETYAFPGNVRELKNIIKRSIVIADDLVISKTLLYQLCGGEYGES